MQVQHFGVLITMQFTGKIWARDSLRAKCIGVLFIVYLYTVRPSNQLKLLTVENL